MWEELTGAARAVDPKISLTLDQAEQVALAELLALHADARRFLKPLAYPDARDLPARPGYLARPHPQAALGMAAASLIFATYGYRCRSRGGL